MARRRIYSRRPHLWRRDNGVYYVVWQEGGTTKKASTQSTKRAVADAALAAFLDEFDGERVAAPPLTLAEAAAEWLRDRERPRNGLQETTLVHYRRWARLFAEGFPRGILARDVTPRHIRRFLDAQEDHGLGPTSLKKLLGGLSMVYRFLIREGAVQVNPCDQVRIKAKAQRHPAMTEEEFRELHAALASEVSNASSDSEQADTEALRDLAVVLWWSGLRFIEATRLSWDDVNLDAGTWEIRSPENKGGTATLPFHPRVREVLERRFAAGTETPFPDYWVANRLWRRFKARHSAFQGWSWHRMRHAFVTRLRRAGKDAAASALVRHKSTAMTDHYTHLTAADLRDDLEAL